MDAGSGPAGFSEDEEEDVDWTKLARVFVLIFNPRTENEGIHSLQLRDEDGVMRNTILCFQDEDDATRFGGLLEAQDFPPAHCEALEPEEILAFVQDAGYETSFVKGGTLFMPPETNVAKENMPWKENPDEYEEEGGGGGGGGMGDEEIDFEEARRRLQNMFNS